MQKAIIIIFIIMMLFTPPVLAANSTFLINNQDFNISSQIVKGRTMVPAQLIKDYFNEYLEWDKQEKKLIIDSGFYNLELKLGNKIAVIDNRPLPLDIGPKLIKDRLFIPARLLTKLYGGQLTWAAKDKAINYQSYQLRDLSFKHNSAKSEVFLATNYSVSYDYNHYQNPNRLVIDLKDTKLGAVNREVITKGKFIAQVRTSQFSINPAVTRVVIDLKENINYSISQLETGIEVELFKRNKPVVASSIVSRNRNLGQSNDTNNSSDHNFEFKNFKVMIDPGHGGTDPGAIGVTGLREKDVNLDIAIQLQRKLIELGYNPILTRRDDQFISLTKRAEQANLRDVDLFISLHANSNPKSWANGTATYAHWYASKKNWAVAWYIQSELIKRIGLADNGLKAANFAVLRETKMPALLVETAFLSNQREEKLLNSVSFQDKVAAGIAAGVERYFLESNKIKK